MTAGGEEYANAELVQTNIDAVNDSEEVEETGTVDLDEICRMAAQQMPFSETRIRP